MRRTIMAAFMLTLLTASVMAEKKPNLVATGDHSIWVLVNDLAKHFTKTTGLTLELIPEIAIVGKGCEKGINHAEKGDPSREFGLICCVLNEQTMGNHGFRAYPIAKEPLTIIVNRSNRVTNLSTLQVREIFAGKINNWKQVGGRDERIAVITKLHCPSHEANWKSILSTAERFSKERIEAKAQPDIARMVADFNGAIGHLEMTSVIESGLDVKTVQVDGYAPTSDNVEKGLYPFVAKLSVLTKGEASGNVLKFIEYMSKDPKAREVMKKYGMAKI